VRDQPLVQLEEQGSLAGRSLLDLPPPTGQLAPQIVAVLGEGVRPYASRSSVWKAIWVSINESVAASASDRLIPSVEARLRSTNPSTNSMT